MNMLATQQFSTDGMTNGAAAVGLARPAPAGELAAFDVQPEMQPEMQVEVEAQVETEALDEATVPERHRQSQKQLAQLAAVAQMLTGLATADAAFQSAMANGGLLEGYLTECHAKVAAAEAGITARHLAVVEALAATEALAAADLQARAAFSAFRQVARTVVTSHSGRTALKLDERVPDQRARFVQVAEGVLTAAQGEPYATLLGAATFGPARIAATLATFDALDQAQRAQVAAQHQAQTATLARDAAMHELALAARQIQVEVRTLLRCHPGLRAPVGF
jgi:hypothetical protein